MNLRVMGIFIALSLSWWDCEYRLGREEMRDGGLGQPLCGDWRRRCQFREGRACTFSSSLTSQRPASRPGSQDGLTQHPLKEWTSKLLEKAVGMLPHRVPPWLCPGQSTEWCFCLPWSHTRVESSTPGKYSLEAFFFFFKQFINYLFELKSSLFLYLSTDK